MISDLWRAAKVTLEGSRAFAAAKRAYVEGKPIPEIVSAWAAETENTADDLAPEKISEALTTASGYLESLAVTGVRIGFRLEAYVPRVTGFLDRTADWLDTHGPEAISRVRSTADTVREWTPKTRESITQAVSACGRLATFLRGLRGDQ